MFVHTHPYPPFVFEDTTKLIVGTLPPPRFTSGELKEGDVDFCYGSRDGLLWPILDRIFGLQLPYETTEEAVSQRKAFLRSRKLGICDIVDRAHRQKVDASDLGMEAIVLRDLIGILRQYPKVNTLLFMGGNSKNGPEYFFRKLLKREGVSLTLVSKEIPRIHEFELDREGEGHRTITTVSLISPSGAANRAIGSIPEYKDQKAQDPKFSTTDFRVLQYAKFL